MSLRVFHIIFVIASILLSFGVAAWSIQQYVTGASAYWLLLAVVFVACGIVLIGYGMKVFRKLKELS